MSGIDLRDLTVVYRSGSAPRTALDAVSLHAENQFVAMLGPNGAGKSTLMNCIARTIRPDQGVVHAPPSRKDLAVVFQTPALDDLLTIRENMVLAGAMHGIKKTHALARFDELATPLGIHDRARDQVRHLSGGLKRRTDLARVLICSPAVLLLDEPTTGLDIDARRQFWEFLRAVRARSPMTVLLATHLTDEADLADRVVMMRQGTILADESPDRFKDALGDRLIRVQAPDEPAAAPIAQWCAARNLDHRAAGSRILIAHADESTLAGCPLGAAEITLARPTLADAYSWHTGAGALHAGADA